MKGPCPACPSSDAFHTYPDGHGFCFSCRHYVPADGSSFRVTGTKATSLLPIDHDAWGTNGLGTRGVSARAARDFGTGWVPGDEPRKAYTYHDAEGRPVAQKVRKRGKEFPWVGDPKAAALFGQQRFSGGGPYVTVAEGEEDALAVYEANDCRYPVVSIKNGSSGAKADLQAQLEWLETFSEVVLMFDMDPPGQEAAQECAALFKPGVCKIARLDGYKDASEALQAGDKKAILSAFWNAKVWRPDGIVSGEALREHLCREIPKGLSVPHTGVQAKTGGFRPREIWLFTAAPGAGKSTMCREFAVHFAKQHGCRIGYVGLEESVQRGLLAITGILDNGRHHLNTEFRGEDAWERHGDFLDKHFVFYDHSGAVGRENLQAKLRYMAVAEECDFIVLDHITIALTEEENERQAIDKLMVRLAALASGSEARIMAVVHIRRVDGKDYSRGAEVTLAALRGSTSLEQVPHTIISGERDTQAETEEERNTVLVRVLKCRETGDTGIAGYMRFDPETGRLLECDSPASDFEQASSEQEVPF